LVLMKAKLINTMLKML